MRKETQVRLRHPVYPVDPAWVTLEPEGKFTGRCRRIEGGEIEREIEIPLLIRDKRITWNTWLSPDKIRTVEYFQCDEAPE